MAKEKENLYTKFALAFSEFVLLTGCQESTPATVPSPESTWMPTSTQIEPTFTTSSSPTPTKAPTLTQTPEPTAISTESPISQEKIDFLANHEIIVGDRSRNIIIMTYDDGGNASKIEAVMNTAENYNGKVTFFMTGKWLMYNSDLAREIVSRGHLLGCHSWDHSEMTSLTPGEAEKQIIDFLEVAKEILPDYQIKYIRFPYGSKNTRLVKMAAEFGLQSVMWGLESGGMDETTYSNVVNNAYHGSIVLSHSTRPYDIQALASIYSELASQGYRFETVETGRSPKDVWIDK